MAQSTLDPIHLRATKPWRASYDPALNVQAGDRVMLGRKDDEHPGWQWVKNADGLGGWVPENILDGSRVATGFNTKELTVFVGDPVTALLLHAGWYWCCDRDGTEGWLPLTHLGAA